MKRGSNDDRAESSVNAKRPKSDASTDTRSDKRNVCIQTDAPSATALLPSSSKATSADLSLFTRDLTEKEKDLFSRLIREQTKLALQGELENLSEVVKEAIRTELTPMINQLTASLQNATNNIVGTVNQIRGNLEQRMAVLNAKITQLENQNALTNTDLRAINHAINSATQMLASTATCISRQAINIDVNDLVPKEGEGKSNNNT